MCVFIAYRFNNHIVILSLRECQGSPGLYCSKWTYPRRQPGRPGVLREIRRLDYRAA